MSDEMLVVVGAFKQSVKRRKQASERREERAFACGFLSLSPTAKY